MQRKGTLHEMQADIAVPCFTYNATWGCGEMWSAQSHLFGRPIGSFVRGFRRWWICSPYFEFRHLHTSSTFRAVHPAKSTRITAFLTCCALAPRSRPRGYVRGGRQDAFRFRPKFGIRPNLCRTGNASRTTGTPSLFGPHISAAATPWPECPNVERDLTPFHCPHRCFAIIVYLSIDLLKRERSS